MQVPKDLQERSSRTRSREGTKSFSRGRSAGTELLPPPQPPRCLLETFPLNTEKNRFNSYIYIY